MRNARQDPLVGRPLPGRRAPLAFGKFPISRKMGPRYAVAADNVSAVLSGVQIEKSIDSIIDAISEMKGMYNRVLRQDRPDWLAVRELLGCPDRAICHLAAKFLSELRTAVVEGQDLQALAASPMGRQICRTARKAFVALRRAGLAETPYMRGDEVGG